MKLHFEAKKHSYRQTQDGVVVSFVMHPNEVNPEFAASPLGTRFMVALAEIGDDEQPKAEPDVEARRAVVRAFNAIPPESVAPLVKSEGERAVTRAVMLAKDPAFQKWATPHAGGPSAVVPDWDEEAARKFIVSCCGIQSRSELKDNVDARMKLYTLITRFESETGRMAEVRS